MGKRPVVGMVGLVLFGLALTGCRNDSCWNCQNNTRKDMPAQISKQTPPPSSTTVAGNNSGVQGFRTTPSSQNNPDVTRTSPSIPDTMHSPSASGNLGMGQPTTTQPTGTSGNAWDSTASRSGMGASQTSTKTGSVDPQSSSGMSASFSPQGGGMPARPPVLDDATTGLGNNSSTHGLPPPPQLPSSVGSPMPTGPKDQMQLPPMSPPGSSASLPSSSISSVSPSPASPVPSSSSPSTGSDGMMPMPASIPTLAPTATTTGMPVPSPSTPSGTVPESSPKMP